MVNNLTNINYKEEPMSESKHKLGSLFSGIGGFEYVGQMYNIEPVWASEVEPACIRITSKHFPNMKHLGDITKINGADIEPVDIITGGSSCQDLSCAGKQSGIKLKCDECGTLVELTDDNEIINCPACGTELSLTRSGLFMEQVRIIKEMRESTNGLYPKFVIWENVTGAYSSNNGNDFQRVLEEFSGLMDEKLPPLRPERWTHAGEILGKSGSIAWRTLDAQYWGVPQRRRRIFLVIDFGGQRASEILFKQESLRRYSTSSKAPWKRIATKIKNSVGISDCNDRTYGIDGYNQTIIKDKSSTLGTNCGTSTGRNGVLCVATQQVNAEIMVDKCPTLTEANGTSGSNKPYVVLPEEPIAFEPGAASRLGGHVWDDGRVGTLRASMGDNQTAVVIDKSTVYGLCSASARTIVQVFSETDTNG